METNKILGAIILALLLAAAFSKVADMAVHPDYPEELAYQIDIPEVSASGAQAEEVDIFAVLPEITPLLVSADLVPHRRRATRMLAQVCSHRVFHFILV